METHIGSTKTCSRSRAPQDRPHDPALLEGSTSAGSPPPDTCRLALRAAQNDRVCPQLLCSYCPLMKRLLSFPQGARQNNWRGPPVLHRLEKCGREQYCQKCRLDRDL